MGNTLIPFNQRPTLSKIVTLNYTCPANKYARIVPVVSVYGTFSIQSAEGLVSTSIFNGLPVFSSQAINTTGNYITAYTVPDGTILENAHIHAVAAGGGAGITVKVGTVELVVTSTATVAVIPGISLGSGIAIQGKSNTAGVSAGTVFVTGTLTAPPIEPFWLNAGDILTYPSTFIVEEFDDYS